MSRLCRGREPRAARPPGCGPRRCRGSAGRIHRAGCCPTPVIRIVTCRPMTSTPDSRTFSRGGVEGLDDSILVDRRHAIGDVVHDRAQATADQVQLVGPLLDLTLERRVRLRQRPAGPLLRRDIECNAIQHEIPPSSDRGEAMLRSHFSSPVTDITRNSTSSGSMAAWTAAAAWIRSRSWGCNHLQELARIVGEGARLQSQEFKSALAQVAQLDGPVAPGKGVGKPRPGD